MNGVRTASDGVLIAVDGVDAEQSIGDQHRQIRELFLEGRERAWSAWNTDAVAEWLALGGAQR